MAVLQHSNETMLTAVYLLTYDDLSNEVLNLVESSFGRGRNFSFGLRDEARQTTTTRSYAALFGGITGIPAIGRLVARTKLCRGK